MGIIRRALMKGQLETPLPVPARAATAGGQGGRARRDLYGGGPRPRTQNQNMRGVVSPTVRVAPSMAFVMAPVTVLCDLDPYCNT